MAVTNVPCICVTSMFDFAVSITSEVEIVADVFQLLLIVIVITVNVDCVSDSTDSIGS